jgi:hypothetical protein
MASVALGNRCSIQAELTQNESSEGLHVGGGDGLDNARRELWRQGFSSLKGFSEQLHDLWRGQYLI